MLILWSNFSQRSTAFLRAMGYYPHRGSTAMGQWLVYRDTIYHQLKMFLNGVYTSIDQDMRGAAVGYEPRSKFIVYVKCVIKLVSPLSFYRLSCFYIFWQLLGFQIRWLRILSCAFYVKCKMRGIDGSASIQNRSVEPSMSLNMTYFLQSSALVSPHIFFSTSSCLFGK